MGFISDIWNKVKPEIKEPATIHENGENLIARLDQNNIDVVKASFTKHIVCNGVPVEIDWPKVVLWTEKNGLTVPNNCYKKQTSRNPQMFVAHWDVCLSTPSMVNVLKDRGLSVHFGIDNDGTIYQLLDTKEIAWHAAGVNNVSVGVEISNGVLLKYNDHYKKVGLPPREIVQSDKVHGNEVGPHLDFYPEQVKAFKALVAALNKAHGIPLKTPRDTSGKYLKAVSKEVVACTFKGVIGHFHVTTNKTDPGSLPIDTITEELANDIKG